MLNVKTISKTSRTISFEIENDKCYYTKNRTNVYLDDQKIDETNKNVFTINGLKSDFQYEIYVQDDINKERSETICVKTDSESSVINVLDFGAKGNGKDDDTAFLHAAVSCCPAGGRIVFPKGKYLSGPIFLKSNITIELQKDAVILGLKGRKNYPILPDFIDTSCKNNIYLASWEGEAQDSFASLITGINVENVNIIGEGTIDGNADFEDWWHDVKNKNIAWRPRTIFLNGCRNVLIEGINVKNSPSWTIHPLMSKNIKFINLNIENPKDAPNTDGIDPESVYNLLIAGNRISVGDDCIAIKSGKISTAKRQAVSSDNITIRNCMMTYGHGAVVIGSEMSGGVKNVCAENCIFKGTDRGLRIKTRRGRGRTGIIDNISLRNIIMEDVKTPFTVNCFYFCDKDGKTEYVWSKDKLEVDDRTPYVGKISVKDVKCTGAEVAAGFVYGLPERKVGSIEMENVHVDFKENAKPDYPEMMSFIKPTCRSGFYFNNIEHLMLKNIKINKTISKPIIKLNINDEKIDV